MQRSVSNAGSLSAARTLYDGNSLSFYTTDGDVETARSRKVPICGRNPSRLSRIKLAWREAV